MNRRNKTLILNNKRLKVFTWHVHGNYLYYLSQANCEFYIPYKKDGIPGYGGRAGTFPWGDNVIEVPVEKVKDMEFDCILYQNRNNYEKDQYEILSPRQRALPKVYVEHDPPQEHPTNTLHHVNDPEILLVHVTHFNKLMWDSQQTPTTVIEHGVMIPDNVSYTGEKHKGIVVVNNLPKRGRRLGLDIFEEVRKEIPLDLVGMGSEEIGGLGEIQPHKLPEFISQYRFFFNPIRYTSLGLSVLEAMMIGLPIVGLATTEMVTTIKNGRSGYISTDIDKLIEHMHKLVADKDEALQLSRGARQTAQQRFNINRFAKDWENIFQTSVLYNKNRLINQPKHSYKDVTPFS